MAILLLIQRAEVQGGPSTATDQPYLGTALVTPIRGGGNKRRPKQSPSSLNPPSMPQLGVRHNSTADDLMKEYIKDGKGH